MRDRVLIKSQVDIPVEGGGAVSTYTVYLTCWTKIEPLTSDRRLIDSQVNLNNGFSFSIRFSSAYTIDKTMLVEYNGKDYTINSIKEWHNRHRFIKIEAITNEQPVQPVVT